ncbi:MAG: substrate-binding domain-containing protein [Spirochaetales bacterium]|nr:substrate-binding domain-containing protein [Spirochaetales bacterium]
MNKNLTFCYLASNIEMGNGRDLWAGISDAARDNHVNLICIPGGRLRDTWESLSQGNVLYDIVRSSSFDGIISWVSNLSNFVPNDEVIDFHNIRFGNVPLVSLGEKLPGRTCVSIDSFRGMYDLMTHLIKEHALTRIAYIRGLENHISAQMRFDAYCAALEDNRIPLREELISDYCDWVSGAGMDSMDTFLNKRKLRLEEDIQCIVCTSDIQAMGVYDYCRENNIWIPGDLALAGFNGGEEGNWCSPPLTTVKADFYKQGYRSLELLLEEIRTGRSRDEEVFLPSVPVIRQTCGCISEGIRSISDIGGEKNRYDSFSPDDEILIEELKALFDSPASVELERQIGDLLQSLERDFKEKGSLHSILSFERLLDLYQPLDGDSTFPRTLISLIEQRIGVDSREAMGRVHSVLSRLNMAAGEISMRKLMKQQRLSSSREALLNDMGQEILTSYDLRNLTDILGKNLKTLQIPGCHLFFYKDRKNPLAGARLIYEYVQDEGERHHEIGEGILSRDFIGHGGTIFGRGHYHYVMEPLYHKQSQMGFALFEPGPLIGTLYRSLAKFISSALDGIMLITELKQTQEALEESYARIEQTVEQRTEELRKEIRERKELEEKLHQSQKMEAVGRLAGGIAHDFNNMLTAINGSAELIGTYENQEEFAFYLDIIQDAGSRAADLVQQLLMFSRKQIIKPVVLNLNDVLQDLQKILRRVIGEDIELSLVTSETELKILFDRSQIEQIVMNLVINSRDAMPGGGRIFIRTRPYRHSLKESFNLDLKPGDYVHIQIEDSGEGIPDEILDKVFEPFFTTKEQGKGTGLGLATVYGIVKQNRGDIRVESIRGERTVFNIFLPLTRAKDAPVSDLPADPSVLRGKERILYAEDDGITRSLTSRILMKSGYSLIEARDGEDALKKVEGLAEPIDLLLTDVVMPGMGGMKLEEEIRRVYPRIRVLYTSGYTQDIIIQKGQIDRDRHFLAKPYSPRSLLELIRNVLDR